MHEKFNDQEILRAVKHFYFILLDMNNDGYVCQSDIYSVFKNMKDSFFISTLLKDCEDLNRLFKMKQKEIIENDLTMR